MSTTESYALRQYTSPAYQEAISMLRSPKGIELVKNICQEAQDQRIDKVCLSCLAVSATTTLSSQAILPLATLAVTGVAGKILSTDDTSDKMRSLVQVKALKSVTEDLLVKGLFLSSLEEAKLQHQIGRIFQATIVQKKQKFD